MATLYLSGHNSRLADRLVATLVIGVAVAGMHYTVMGGSVFRIQPGIDMAHGIASLGQSKITIEPAYAVSVPCCFFVINIAQAQIPSAPWPRLGLQVAELLILLLVMPYDVKGWKSISPDRRKQSIDRRWNCVRRSRLTASKTCR